jgi:hypothetical protein
MLFPRGKGDELFDFSLWKGAGKVKYGGAGLDFGLRTPNLMFPVAY